MKTIKVPVYTYRQLSLKAQERATDLLCNEASMYAPTPAVVLLAIQQKRLFLKDGTPIQGNWK